MNTSIQVQRDPYHAYFKVTGGEALKICLAHHLDSKEKLDAVAAVVQRHGAKTGHMVNLGTKVIGLCFDRDPGGAWKPFKKMPGYYQPNKRHVDGREIVAELSSLRCPDQTALAQKLGCPPCAQWLRQIYMASAGMTYKSDQLCYVETLAGAAPDLKKLGEGIVQVKKPEYDLETEVVTSAQAN